jgi:hypothetical protein
MQRELDKYFGPNAVAERPASADLAEWFAYVDTARRTGQRISLKEVAQATQYNYGYVRRKHADFVRRNGNKK